VLSGTILSVKQLLKKIGDKNFRTNRRALYKLKDEMRVNPDMCGRIRVDVEFFEFAKKYLWIKKYPGTCGRGLNG